MGGEGGNEAESKCMGFACVGTYREKLVPRKKGNYVSSFVDNLLERREINCSKSTM
jgi:hypothetical protein